MLSASQLAKFLFLAFCLLVTIVGGFGVLLPIIYAIPHEIMLVLLPAAFMMLIFVLYLIIKAITNMFIPKEHQL